MQGRCRQCKCSLVENPNFKSSKCHECEKQMKTKGKRLDSIVFTNADPRYVGKGRIKFYLANVGAHGVSVAVGICE